MRHGLLRWRSATHAALGVVLAAVVAVVAACTGADTAPRVGAVGGPAPSYVAERMDGSKASLAELQGQVVLVNIWATWCKPCRQEIPALDTLFRRYADSGFTVVGVSIDQDGSRGPIRQYAQDLGASYSIWYDPDDRVSTLFLAIGVPASFLIDRAGTVRWRHVGPVTAGDSALNAAVSAALASAAP